MMEFPSRVEVVEVGPRDGFQNIKTFIPTAVKLQIIAQLIAAGVRKMEVTSFVHPKAIPQMADAAEIASTVCAKYQEADFVPLALVPNLVGAKNAYRCGIREVAYVISASEKHNLANINRTRDQSLVELASITSELPDLKVRLDVATAFGCPFLGRVDDGLVLSLIEAGLQRGISTVVLCDTIGVANPKQVYNLVRAVQNAFPNIPLGLHLHDTRGMGLANTLAGLAAGVTSFETSVGGLGGCPFAPGAAGNTATEDMVNMLQAMGVATGIDLDKCLAVVQTVRDHIQAELTGHMGKACRYDNL
ncbi:pyruvate carboxyltransferase [Thermosinus carboxydivorans Nor1]|uniref:Pyruvate carboxyltransferase n=1 Tax=Thermosinus carboxydivorans Nor1 TaxID=401526 RepID=A1HRC2_9FIRM|nr:hydroxymethylglutaryl-CoA lyase [Thermosinus carboxydivorans]EAX47437.1 pyruvate carboxyltransferase [Thermosinus carboxydivorans Nor1]